MSYFYQFLENQSPKLARTLSELESVIYNNPRAMLTHSRALIERLMEKVMQYEDMQQEPYISIAGRIQRIDDEGLITAEVRNALHEVRKLGNIAAHDTRALRFSESLIAWENLYIIVKWYVEIYVSYDILFPDYVDPVIESSEPSDMEELLSKMESFQSLLEGKFHQSVAQVNEERDHEQLQESNERTISDTDETGAEMLEKEVEASESIHKDDSEEALLWQTLNNLAEDKGQTISYDEVQRALSDNPSKFMTLLDGLFLKLSFNRMTDLAADNQREKLSDAYFQMDKMALGWKEIHIKLGSRREEYDAALTFCKISEEKFKRNLTEADAEEALTALLKMVSIWQQDKQIATDKTNADQSEVAATTVEAEAIVTEVETEENMATQQNQQFISKLDVLRMSSQESVVHADSFGAFREYMHVKRPIQEAFETVLSEAKEKDKPQLILLCGSVGDGKSHLLAYMKEKRPELTEDVLIHNDSTESFNPEENSLDTLEYILQHFDDGADRSQAKHTVIAINLGVLHNFYARQKNQGRFTELCDFIDQSGIFQHAKDPVKAQGVFHLLNFAEEQPYVLTKDGTVSPFFMDLMKKVTKPTDDNPFYQAWLSDINQGYETIAHENYRLLQNDVIQASIVQLLIESIVKQKIFISTRTFYNFLYEIIVPIPLNRDESVISYDVKDMLPNLMYAHPERSELLEALSFIDPVKRRSKTRDQFNSNFVLSTSPQTFIREQLGEEALVGAWRHLETNFDAKQQDYIRLLIRHDELLHQNSTDEAYQEFIWYLYAYYAGDGRELAALFELIRDVIFKWKGSPKDDYIYINSLTDAFRLAVEIKIEPEIDEAIYGSANTEEISRFTPSIRLGFSQGEKVFLFELDYQLYVLLKEISEGYRPNWQKLQDTLQFSELHDQLVKSADKTKEVLIVHGATGDILKVKKQPRFEKTKFLVEKVHARGI